MLLNDPQHRHKRWQALITVRFDRYHEFIKSMHTAHLGRYRKCTAPGQLLLAISNADCVDAALSAFCSSWAHTPSPHKLQHLVNRWRTITAGRQPADRVILLGEAKTVHHLTQGATHVEQIHGIHIAARRDGAWEAPPETVVYAKPDDKLSPEARFLSSHGLQYASSLLLEPQMRRRQLPAPLVEALKDLLSDARFRVTLRRAFASLSAVDVAEPATLLSLEGLYLLAHGGVVDNCEVCKRVFVRRQNKACCSAACQRNRNKLLHAQYVRNVRARITR